MVFKTMWDIFAGKYPALEKISILTGDLDTEWAFAAFATEPRDRFLRIKCVIMFGKN